MMHLHYAGWHGQCGEREVQQADWVCVHEVHYRARVLLGHIHSEIPSAYISSWLSDHLTILARSHGAGICLVGAVLRYKLILNSHGCKPIETCRRVVCFIEKSRFMGSAKRSGGQRSARKKKSRYHKEGGDRSCISVKRIPGPNALQRTKKNTLIAAPRQRQHQGCDSDPGSGCDPELQHQHRPWVLRPCPCLREADGQKHSRR